MTGLLRRQNRRERPARRAYIEGYGFPRTLREKIGEEFEPALGDGQVSTVLEGLRAWFVVCLYSGRKTLGMPSQAVDVAWHQFILLTREYHDFCEHAFGYYLHHTPQAAMKEPMTQALRRTVKVADRYQASLAVASIPFLFAIDSSLGLAEGNFWRPEDIELLRSSRAVAGDAGSGLYLAAGDGGDGDGGGDGCGGCGD